MSLVTSETAGNRAMTLSTWWGGKMLQSAVRARARESRSLAGAPVADPKGPHKAPSPQPSCAQAERPGNRVAPCRRAHGSVGPLRWDGRSLCGSPGRSPARSPASAWTSGPDWLWGFGRWGRAGRDNEALGATQSGQRDPGARPQLGPGEGRPEDARVIAEGEPREAVLEACQVGRSPGRG